MSGAADRPAPAGLSRLRLFVVLACLYLAQAIPSYLFAAAIPPILREQGVSRTAIGMMALLMLPLVLKFLWAPLVDRFRPLARAHRAGWVIITQIGVIAGIAAMGSSAIRAISAGRRRWLCSGPSPTICSWTSRARSASSASRAPHIRRC